MGKPFRYIIRNDVLVPLRRVDALHARYSATRHGMAYAYHYNVMCMQLAVLSFPPAPNSDQRYDVDNAQAQKCYFNTG